MSTPYGRDCLATLPKMFVQSVNVGILDGKGNMTIIMREASKQTLSMGIHDGLTAPAYAHSIGKALLSELS